MRKLFTDYLNEIPKEALFEQYIVNNLSNRECCEFFNTSPTMLSRILKEYNIKKSKKASAEIGKRTKLEKYGSAGYNNRDKAKQTCIETYGVENVFQREEIKSKSEQTKLERYNNAHFVNPEKNLQTKIDRYGSIEEAYRQRNLKSAEIFMERYGVENAALAEEVKNKIINTQKINWASKSEEEKQTIADKISKANKGRTVWNKGKKVGPVPEVKKAEILAKQYETKKNNNSFNSSSSEESFYTRLLALFAEDDIIKQYSTDPRYPFNCDFYIKSLDLFIELNFNWTHGYKLFEGTEQDLCRLHVWETKAITSDYYKNAIETWTKRDTQKYATATANNLNYLVYYLESELENFEEDIKLYA
jgi:hypothetical protein